MVNKNITFYLFALLILQNLSYTMGAGSLGHGAHPGVPGVEIIDFLPQLHNPQPSWLNNSQVNDNFQADWSTISLLNDATRNEIGLNFNPALDRIADSLLSQQASAMTNNEVLQDTAIIEPTLVSTPAHASGVTTELQELADRITTPTNQIDNAVNVRTDSLHHSSEAINDNRHAIEPVAVHQESSDSAKGGPLLPNQLSKNTILRGEQVTKRLELLIASSSDPKALAAQIEASKGKTLISREVFSERKQAEYRDFLWDSKDFKPINTPERQEQALNILYPVIKNHFVQDRVGLIKFLEKQVELKIPGAQRLLNYETGKTTLSGHASNLSRSIGSGLASLNFLKNRPSIQQIEQGKFIQHLAKIVALCKAEKFKEAKNLIESIRRNICSQPEEGRTATIEEYDCLCNLYENIYKTQCNELGIKLEYIKDPFYGRFEGSLKRGALRPDEANVILEGRNHTFHDTLKKMECQYSQLTIDDRKCIYDAIDNKMKDSVGLEKIVKKQEVFNENEIFQLKEKLEWFSSQKDTDGSSALAPASVAQANLESTAKASVEETEPIERKIENVEGEISITADPPPFDPKEPHEKENEQKEIENNQIKKEEGTRSKSIKESDTYKESLDRLSKNTNRFKELKLNPISKKTLKHIINEHTPAGVKGISSNKSMFNLGEDFIELLIEAWEKGTSINETTKIYDTGRVIGFNRVGEATTKVRVVLDESLTTFGTIYPI